jgi:hypothetical protein
LARLAGGGGATTPGQGSTSMLGSCRPISETWFLQVRTCFFGTKSFLSGLMCLVIYQCCFLCNASHADFSEEPAFHHSKILFSNGYAFDEFFPDVIASSIDCAIDSGTAVFFYRYMLGSWAT